MRKIRLVIALVLGGAGVQTAAAADSFTRDRTGVIDAAAMPAPGEAAIDGRDGIDGTAREALDSCRSECAERARQVYLACIERGGDTNRCEELARNAFGGCLERCRERRDPCRARCHELAREAYQRCRDAGGDEESCRDVAADVVRGCFRRCAAPGCIAGCEALAQGGLTRCLDSGRAPDVCRHLARELFEGCAKDCRPPCPPPPPATCAEQCREVGGQVLERCLRAGGDRATCARHAAEAVERCGIERCPPTAA